MVQLTGRQQAILEYLLGVSEPVPVREIAKRCSLSERTIRYDLETLEVWLKGCDGELVKRPNAGILVKMEPSARGKALRSFSGNEPGFRVLTPKERSETIFYLLLFSEGAVTADELAGKILVSRPTVMNDLRSMNQSLAANELSVASKKGEGYRLQGSETALRACLVEALGKLMADCHAISRYSLTNRVIGSLPRTGGLKDLALNYLASVDLDALSNLVSYSREVVHHTMPENDYIRFLLYLAVVVRRAGAGVVPEEQVAPAQSERREWRLASILAERMNGRFRLNLGGTEVDRLALWLVSCNIKFPPKTDDKLMDRLSSIVDEMLLVLLSYPNYDMPDFYRDKLKMNLLSHLRLTVKKYHLKIPSSNPLLTQMKVNYPEIFTVVYKMAELFEEKTQIPLDEDEIGFIAIHIAASIEECSKLRSKKALIVCNTGRGAAMVLNNRIRNNIPRLEIKGTLAALDAENKEALRGVDFIISTVDLPQLDKPVFRVSPIISTAEIDHINNYLNGKLADPGQGRAESQSYLNISLSNLIDKYVSPGEREKCRSELNALVGLESLPVSSGIRSEENTMFQCSMILAKLGSGISEISQTCQLEITSDKVFGIVIHILMSIPRWRKGLSNREYASEKYKNDHIDVYEHIVRCLREVSTEYGMEIPDKEALALMRYFI